MTNQSGQEQEASSDVLFMDQAAQGRSFEDLSGFEQIIASLFMFLARSFDPGSGNGGISELFAGILGTDSEGFREWHQDMEENDWNWQETQDFTNFDFDRAEDMVTSPPQGLNPPRSLLDLIAEHESGGDYNVVYGGSDTVTYNGQSREITDMTVNEVLDWQEQYVNNGSPSSAAGRYQIINNTLEGLKEELGLTGNEKFDEAMQDRMAMTLLERRGLDEFLDGEMSEQQFMLKLSQEWASLPKNMGGQSYYAGDGLNRALVDPETVLAAIEQTRTEHQTELASAETERTTSFAKTIDGDTGGPSIKTAFTQAHDNVTPDNSAVPGTQPQPEVLGLG